MHIEIHIFPNSFPISPGAWSDEMTMLMGRIQDFVLDATVNSKAAALGQTTLVDEKTNYVVATIDIRTE